MVGTWKSCRNSFIIKENYKIKFTYIRRGQLNCLAERESILLPNLFVFSERQIFHLPGEKIVTGMYAEHGFHFVIFKMDLCQDTVSHP